MRPQRHQPGVHARERPGNRHPGDRDFSRDREGCYGPVLHVLCIWNEVRATPASDIDQTDYYDGQWAPNPGVAEPLGGFARSR